MRITVSLDADMPSGVTLELEMDAPAGAASTGSTALSAIDADLVTGIGSVSEQLLEMTYTLNADATAEAVESGIRTVTFTITDDSI